MYQVELRRGVDGRGQTIFSLFVFTETQTIAIHHFTTKSEALAFYRCGTTYGPLDDLS